MSDLDEELRHWKRRRRIASREFDAADEQVQRLEALRAFADDTPEERRALMREV